MRKILTAVAIFLASLTPILAQGFVPAAAPPWVYADNYGRWAIQGQTPDSYSFSPASVCQVNQLNFQNTSVFFAFGSQVALAPVLVADVNGANSEVVTPGSAATQTAVACSVNISPVNSHTTFSLQSGTGGLQEAINALGGSTKTVPYTVVLSPEWYKRIQGISSLNAALTASVTPAGVIGNATCTSNIQVVDVTANPWSFYSCDPATSKLVVSDIASKPPTATAGTGAGTSPTITVAAGSSASTGTVTVLSGTAPTASAAIVTLALPTAAAGGFPYAPACTMTSVGVNPYKSGVVSTNATPDLILTASATALAATTTYVFTYTCH